MYMQPTDPKDSYFPIKVKYDNGDIVVVQSPRDLRDCEGFVVLALNVSYLALVK